MEYNWKILGSNFNLEKFDLDHDFDGFFVYLLKSSPMRMMLNPLYNTFGGKVFDGVGFDTTGEHFDILEGTVNENGDWSFLKLCLKYLLK